ncbi:MAG: hypothetical protein ABW096_06550 [Candidatus Thiodiazotropha sp.]
MFKLNDDLKRILSGLAYQDTGEYMTTRSKMELLGIGPEQPDAATPPPLKMVKKPVARRIAFISDGRGHGAPLDYAIETCSRMEAKIDLLIHDSADEADIALLEEQITSADLHCQTVLLGANPVEEIINYIQHQPSIASIVAMPDDDTARTIMDEIVSGRGGSMPVPLVLIEDRSTTPSAKQSAA